MEQTFIEIAGIIGDVHTQDAALGVALDFLKNHPRLDQLLCTGDILGGEGSLERCCELLEEAGVLSVRGNHERWHFESEPFVEEIIALAQPEDLETWPVRLSTSARSYLASLPILRTFQTPHGELLLCHGLGQNDMAGIYPDDAQDAVRERLKQCDLYPSSYRFVINGHTHQASVHRSEQMTLINAGTLLPHSEASFCIVDFRIGQVKFFRITTHAAVTQVRTYPLV